MAGPVVLPGASRVATRVRSGKMLASADLDVVRRSWIGSASICARHGWHRAMHGVSVTLRDHAAYVAQFYDDDRLIICVPLLAKHPEPVGVLVHEFGHRVWFRCLTEAQRVAWRNGWRDASARGALVSEYAETNEIEDFAEVFRALAEGKLDAANRRRWAAVRQACDRCVLRGGSR